MPKKSKATAVAFTPEVVLPALAEACERFGTMIPRWNFNSRNPSHDFAYAVETTVGAWMPPQHDEFMKMVSGKTIEFPTIMAGLKNTKEIIFKALGVTTSNDRHDFDPKVLSHYPPKPEGSSPDSESTAAGELLPEDAKAARKLRRQERRRLRQEKKESTSSTDEENDMTAAKKSTAKKPPKTTKAAKPEGPKSKPHPNGSKGQLSVVGKRDWTKLPDTKKVKRGDQPRQMSSAIGKAYDSLPTGTGTITVGALVKKVETSQKVSEDRARRVVYNLVNKFHAKLA